MRHSKAQHNIVKMHHPVHTFQHGAVTLHHPASAYQHSAAALPLSAGNLHGKESPADCTLVACDTNHPAAPLAIRRVPTTATGTPLELSGCTRNHTVHHTTMCSSCYLCKIFLMSLFAAICHRSRVVHIVIDCFFTNGNTQEVYNLRYSLCPCCEPERTTRTL